MDEFDLDSALSSITVAKTETESTSKAKTEKKTLYTDKDIEPKSILALNFKKSDVRSFTVFDTGKVPDDKIELFKKVATLLFSKGFVYRSKGDSKNKVDEAIRNLPNAKVKIYRLWKKATCADNGFPTESEQATRVAYEVTCNYHKTFLEMKDIVRCHYAVNTQLILGAECDNPVNFLLTYTDCGSTTFGKKFNIKNSGSVWLPMKLAIESNLPICNLGSTTFTEEFKNLLQVIGLTNQEPKPEPKPETTTQGLSSSTEDIWD